MPHQSATRFTSLEIAGLALAVTVGFTLGLAESVLCWRLERWYLPRELR